jgi:hypothetical protein
MTIRTLSSLLNDIQTQLTSDRVSFAALLTQFHERGFGFFLFLFALPAAIPLPGLGINTIIALPLLFLTAQMALGRKTIWMPEKIKQKNIASDNIKSLINRATPWITKIEHLIKPRLEFMTQAGISNFVGVMTLFMALAVAVPLPLTNTVPSMGLAMVGVGLMMRDGLAIIGGVFIGICWIILLSALIIFIGSEGIDLFKEFIRNLI